MLRHSVSIRPAKLHDLQIVVELLKELHESSVYNKFVSFNIKEVKETYTRMLELPFTDALVFVTLVDSRVVGVFAASRMKYLFNSKHWTAIELAFYILPEHRNFSSIRLTIKEYFRWAKINGCKTAVPTKDKARPIPAIATLF